MPSPAQPEGVPFEGTLPTSRILLTDLIPGEPEEDVLARPSYSVVDASMVAHGTNLVPALVRPSKTHPGKWDIKDGSMRYWIALRRGFKDLLAVELERDLSKIEEIVYACTFNGARRVMMPEEWAAKALALMELDSSLTQADVARMLNRSEASLSRDLTTLLLPAKHADAARKLVPAIRSLIAPIKDPSLQDRAVAFASTPDASGKLPSRDTFVLWLKQQKPKKGRKPKALKGRLIDGREIVVGLKPGETTSDLIAALEDAIKRLRKYGDGPPDALGFVLR